MPQLRSPTRAEESPVEGATPPPDPINRKPINLAYLRARPEYLFLPLAALWLLVNVAPWGFGTSYLYAFYLAFTLQKSNVIFPFTYAFAVVCFAAVMSAGIRWTRLGWVRTLLIAGSVPFAGPGAFEVAFQETGKYIHPGLFIGYALPYVMFSYGTWAALGLTGLGWWRITWRWWLVLGYSVAGFVLWIAIGFPLVTTGTFSQLPAAYLLNISLKGTFYLVFVLPILEGMYARRSRGADRPVGAPMGVADPETPAVTSEAESGGGFGDSAGAMPGRPT